MAPMAPGSGRAAAHRKAILLRVIARSSAKGHLGWIALSQKGAFLFAAMARPEALRAFRPAIPFERLPPPPSSSAGGVGPSALSAVTARGAPRTLRYASAPGRSAFAHFGSGPRGSLGALRPGPGWIPGGPTQACREHAEEAQQRRRPALGQPGGTPRLGRAAVFRLVADALGHLSPRRVLHRIPRRRRRARDPSGGPTQSPTAPGRAFLAALGRQPGQAVIARIFTRSKNSKEGDSPPPGKRLWILAKPCFRASPPPSRAGGPVPAGRIGLDCSRMRAWN